VRSRHPALTNSFAFWWGLLEAEQLRAKLQEVGVNIGAAEVQVTWSGLQPSEMEPLTAHDP
jgi:hypothetical protein